MNAYQKNIKTVSEQIEKTVYAKKTKDIRNLGIILALISLLCLSFSITGKGIVSSNLIQAIIEHKLPSVITVFVLHVLIVLVLVIPKMPDRFQFATLFTLINIPMLFRALAVVCDYNPPPYANLPPLSFACVFLMFGCWILFGLEATRQKSTLLIFRLFGKLNAWIQKKYDEGKF